MDKRYAFLIDDGGTEYWVSVETDESLLELLNKGKNATGTNFTEKMLRGVPYAHLVEGDLFLDNPMYFDYNVKIDVENDRLSFSKRLPTSNTWKFLYFNSLSKYVKG